MPADIAFRAESVGAENAELDPSDMFMPPILAGAFVAKGAVYSSTVGTGGITIEEIARNAAEAAKGSTEIARNITAGPRRQTATSRASPMPVGWPRS